MNSTPASYTSNWFAVSLRWMALMGALISLARAGALLSGPTALLVALVTWNSILTVAAGLGSRFNIRRQINLALDILIIGLYFFRSGGYASPAFWIVCLPILTGALYFQLRGALVSGLAMIAVQLATTLLRAYDSTSLLVLGGAILTTLLLSGIFGAVSLGLFRALRRESQGQFDTMQKDHRIGHERLRAIYSLTSTLTATLNYQRVLESVLNLSLSALSSDPENAAADPLISAVLLFSKEKKLEVGSARRLTPADLRVVLDGRSGVLAQAIEQDQPQLLTEVRNDPELVKFISYRNCKEIYVFPLRSGLSAYGVLLFGHPDRNYFTPDRCEILEILGRQAVVAIQNARLYQDIVDERERMIEVQEEARKKLARDLHDGPTQSVSAIAMRVNMLKRMLVKDPKSAVEELGRIEDLALRTTKEIRHMLFTLRPLVLESKGLVAALQSMAEKTKETFSQEVVIAVEEEILNGLEMGKQSVVFFIVEEAVNNARKHARAPHIWVNLRPIEQEIALLEVRDDGAGFDLAAVNQAYDQRGSLGMINLRERAELINGVLNMQSAPGKGTCVQVYIPLTEEAADRLHHASGQR
jgi:signal transduction histidine kinase